ncbi:unnamed protein product [Heterobilharzia americana]|nr:unnamed protein product [Heterobilharzia americana]
MQMQITRFFILHCVDTPLVMSLSCLDDSRWLSVILPDATDAQPTPISLILDPLANEHYQLLLGELSNIKMVSGHGLFQLGSRWILYIDIVGVVRTVDEREKFCIVDLDDGTGCLTCTIWHRDWFHNTYNHLTSGKYSFDVEQNNLCEQIVKLSYKSQPVSSSSSHRHSSGLKVGQTLQLSGRLTCFRGKLKLNAYFCRLVKDEGELLNQIIHRYHLHQEIYSQPYDPETVAKNVKKSHVTNLANSLVTETCRILVQDNIRLFTKLDLCLHPKIVESITENWTSLAVAYDETEADYLRQSFIESEEKEEESSVKMRSLNPKQLQLIVHSLIDRLLIEGWIFPSNQSICGMQTYHVVKENWRLLDVVYNVVRSQGADKELSLHSILHNIRQCSNPNHIQLKRITLNAMKHLLNQLECESRIYQSNPGYYKVA